MDLVDRGVELDEFISTAVLSYASVHLAVVYVAVTYIFPCT